HGLGIFTNGAVTLRNLSANENHGAGAYITNYGEAPRYRPVSIMYADFNNNTNGDGLYVTSLAPVTVKFVNASGNDGQDLNLPATFDGSGSGSPALVVERIVDRSTDPEADMWNFRIGEALTPNLFIVVNATESVTVTLQKYDTGTTSWQVVATETGAGIQMDFDGIEYAIQSEGLYRVIIAETTNTTVEYTLVLKENAASNPTSPGRTGANGLDLYSYFTLQGGVPVKGQITIQGMFSGDGRMFDENAASGIQVSAAGTISLYGVQAAENGQFGAFLQNFVGNSTVSGSSNRFESNQGSGLYVLTYGTVTLNNINAESNGLNSLSIAIYRRFGIEVSAGSATIQLKTTTANFRNSVSGNYFGLGFHTTGSAAIQNTDVENNTSSGAFIKYSSGTPLLGKVTVTNSDFIGNGTYGLDMLTGSKVYLDKVNASDNSNFGVRLYNDQTNALVSIKRGIFERNNTGYGLEVRVLGVITVDSVQVNGNADKGAILDNQEVGQTGSVTLKASYWTNRFLENAAGAGLEVLSNGAIKLYTLEASRNGAAGLLLESAGSTVYVKEAQFSSNGGSGIQTTSLGDTWLYNVTSQANAGNGAYLTSDGGTFRVYSSAFGYNTGNGLWLDIPAIANYYLSNVTYYGNGLEDRKIDVTP
ncbi:MAG: right-handed parallel beta-helix repeat-containing protein, partial [Anaerolineae bacterium]|nr:right-handed parallel beta-helix repeat-containing protein [Anaerolineae bacterium]